MSAHTSPVLDPRRLRPETWRRNRRRGLSVPREVSGTPACVCRGNEHSVCLKDRRGHPQSRAMAQEQDSRSVTALLPTFVTHCTLSLVHLWVCPRFRHINIGSRFQAEIPDLQDSSLAGIDEHVASLVWKPWGDVMSNPETQDRGGRDLGARVPRALLYLQGVCPPSSHPDQEAVCGGQRWTEVPSAQYCSRCGPWPTSPLTRCQEQG